MFQLKNEVIRNSIVNAVSLKMFGFISVKSYRNLKAILFFPNQQKILIINIRILILKPVAKRKAIKNIIYNSLFSKNDHIVLGK